MLNIGICFNRKDFEYDVYSLVKAFYPQSQVQMYYLGEEPAGEYQLLLLVTYGDQEICLEIEKDNNQLLSEIDSLVAEKYRLTDEEKSFVFKEKYI